jgi:hypothetical protein
MFVDDFLRRDDGGDEQGDGSVMRKMVLRIGRATE